MMKKIVLALFVISAMTLCSCSGVGLSDQAAGGADSPDSTAVSQTGARTVTFNGIELEIPESWSEVEVDPGTMEDAACWHFDEGGVSGNLIAYSMRYEAFGNTDTQMPDPADPSQQEVKKKLDLGLKALDARVMLSMVAEGNMRTIDEAAAIDQTEFMLEERQGHAVWVCDCSASDGRGVGCCVALDDRMVALFILSGEGLTEDQTSTLDSLIVTEDSDALMLDRARLIEGKTQDEAMEILANDSEIHVPVSSDSSSSKPLDTTSSRPRNNSSNSGSSGSQSSKPKKKRPEIGMTAREVEEIWGRPDRKTVHEYAWGTSEQWVYGDGNYYIYFENGVVTSITSH